MRILFILAVSFTSGIFIGFSHSILLSISLHFSIILSLSCIHLPFSLLFSSLHTSGNSHLDTFEHVLVGIILHLESSFALSFSSTVGLFKFTNIESSSIESKNILTYG
jgi:hypothetical protein